MDCKGWLGSGTRISLVALLNLLFIASGLAGTATANNSLINPGNHTSVSAATNGISRNIAPRGPGRATFGRLPLVFLANQGQKAAPVKFYARGAGVAMFFTPHGIHFSLRPGTRQKCSRRKENPFHRPPPKLPRPTIVQLTPLEMKKAVEIVAADPRKGKINYFIGSDPKLWRTNIPTYGAVVYREAYPGIDLKFYGTGRQLEYDLIIKPGADPARVRFQCRGIKGLELTQEGDLTIKLRDGGELIQNKPILFQEIGGRRVAREGSFVLHQDGCRFIYGFAVAGYDKRYPLIIDPMLVFSTYLGGQNDDVGNDIAVDGEGNLYVTGWTESSDFPAPDALFSKSSGFDAFVTKINSSGTELIYSTYLGGNDWDSGQGIAVDREGNAYVTGLTRSVNFPTKNSLYPYKAKYEVFVTKINPTGNDLVYSTYLGGEENDGGNGIAADPDGNAYVTGYTGSSDFPTSLYNYVAYQDVFVTKINPTGTDLIYSTYLGGYDNDVGEAIAVDQAGNAWVTGQTYSPYFPKHNELYDYTGYGDAFVTKINAAGTGLSFSTFLGGEADDKGLGIAVDGDGNAYVTGHTKSVNFPTTPDRLYCYKAKNDAFVTKINAAASALVYSTYLGGMDDDEGLGIAVDQGGNTYVTGATRSEDFPTQAPLYSHQGEWDAFVTRINASGSDLGYSTYLGGSSCERGLGIAVDQDGNALVTGTTTSTDFPTLNSLYPDHQGGGYDAFLTKIYEPLPGTISLSPVSLSNFCPMGQDAPGQSFEVWNSEDGSFSYEISADVPWLSCTPESGATAGEHDTITVNYSTSGLGPGIYNTTITISAPVANSPQQIPITLAVGSKPMPWIPLLLLDE